MGKRRCKEGISLSAVILNRRGKAQVWLNFLSPLLVSLPPTSSAVFSFNLWLTKLEKAISITVTIHLLSTVLIEDDKL